MERFNYLFNQYISKNATDAERAEFQDMLQLEGFDEQLKKLIDGYMLTAEFDHKNIQLGTGEEILQAVFAVDEERVVTKKPKRLWPKIAIAASIAVAIFGGTIFFTSRNAAISDEQTISAASRLQPGTSSATLILASGKKIILSSAMNGKLAEESGVTISKSADGQLIYEIKDDKNNTSNGTNTLSTAKGETYQVRLPDGTSVWLNSVSTLQYPTSFAALKERRVRLTGEGYFQVAKDKLHPFIVATKNQEVEVLGTHFNINSYAEEPVTRTTLLEGSVKVASLSRSENAILRPGQQASLSSGEIAVNEVEVEDVIAWKNGFFTFQNENIESIMAKVSRWYNIDVEYKDAAVKEMVLNGSFSRFDNFATVVRTLERTKLIKIEVVANRVIISRSKQN